MVWGHPWAAGGGTAQGLSLQEKRMMEMQIEGLAWGWLRACCGLGQVRVPLATGSHLRT